MSKAVFTLPDTAKPLNSETTKKIYKRHLNRLAALDFDTIEKIVAAPEDVIQAIDLFVSFEKDKEKRKAEARVYYSAVFYVLYEHPFLKDPENILRISFQRFRPNLGDKKWVPLEEYKKSQDK